MRAPRRGPRVRPAWPRPASGGLALLATAALALGAGCGSSTGERSAASAVAGCPEAPAGDTARPARRVVSLLPAVSEIVVAIGAGDRLVARTDHDSHPALAGLPSVGGGLTPSLERLALLRPDLVVTWPDNASRSLARPLGALDIRTHAAETETLEDVYETACWLGRRLGAATAADSLVHALAAELDAVRRGVRDRPRPSVLYVLWADPPTTAGPGSFIGELIEIAGGRNAFADAQGYWPQVSLEEIVRREPDVVVLPRTAGGARAEELARAPGWRELRAVRERRVVEVDGDLFHRPGPALGRAARELAAGLHQGFANSGATTAGASDAGSAAAAAPPTGATR